ncbi:hypothetical protein I5907_13450 [Panacibacter sp. DH6]|uniref:Lipocalin-like domain-containing protein n=1 Tax=Panacibacter microcysteis TaxID=2793269 RepID=A0A931E8C2_9BACT|nr:hypothetical protein [Panacibacter microcysteis]MBG9377241.1 hypothetical protein [Panacibacter microcysteis]
MKNFTKVVCAALLAVSVISCQKDASEPNVNASAIQGTWDFVSMSLDFTTSNAYTISGVKTESVASGNYTTENNTGVITIDASNMTSANLSYTVNSTVNAAIYEDGQLIEEFEQPFNVPAITSNGSAAYRVVSADSLYFEGGTVFTNGVTQASQPSGAKYRVEGNRLYITQIVKQTTTQNQAGIVITSSADGTAEITLQKK